MFKTKTTKKFGRGGGRSLPLPARKQPPLPAPAAQKERGTASLVILPRNTEDRRGGDAPLRVDNPSVPLSLFTTTTPGVIFRRNRKIIPGLVRGDKPLVLPKDAPRMTWEGKRLSAETFRLALSFCKWTYDRWKGEAQGKLFYHPVTGDWKFAPLPQLTPQGMTTKECPEDAEYARLLGEWTRKGYVLNGTLHHHCSISSFQSGTDEADEKASNGLHITVGKLEDKSADYHSRFVLNKVTYDDIPLSDFIDGDTSLLSLSDLPDMPEEWAAVFRERPTAKEPARTEWKGWTSWDGYYGGDWEGWEDEKSVTPATPSDVGENPSHKDIVLFFHATVLSELQWSGGFCDPPVMGESEMDDWEETLVPGINLPDALIHYEFPPLFLNTDENGRIPKGNLLAYAVSRTPSLFQITNYIRDQESHPQLLTMLTSMETSDKLAFSRLWELWLRHVWTTLLLMQTLEEG